MAEANPTPKFKRPPVIETLLGVQFGPLRSFSIPHFGLFWSQIRSQYPHQEMKPPLGPEVEDFGMSVTPGGVQVMLTTEPDARCWFIDSSQTQLIQLQRDRFIRNWRKVTGEETYPEYAVLKPRFEQDWTRFLHFLDDAGIERPEVNLCEATYVNHIPIGVGAETGVDDAQQSLSDAGQEGPTARHGPAGSQEGRPARRATADAHGSGPSGIRIDRGCAEVV